MLKCKMMYSVLKLCYLGDEHSHTYAAARVIAPTAKLTGCGTVSAALAEVESGNADGAVVPLENSIEGAVNESSDGIAERSLYIARELSMPIHQCLIAQKGVRSEDITLVYSHVQALSQCRKYLQKNLPKAVAEAVAFTSKGLKMLGGNSACIAGAAGLDEDSGNLQILERDIEDEKTNTTRFVLVTAKPSLSGNKASIMVTTRDEAGALLRVLKVFFDERINMTRLESRPNREKLGGYNFFIDFNFDSDLNNLLAKIQEHCVALKFLGSY